MKSKTSLFNTSLMCKNFQRFWPVALGYLVILFFILPFAANTSAADGGFSPVTMAELMLAAQQPVFTAIVALISALLCFSYLFGSRSCNMMHAFPLSRGQLFASNYVSGLLLMIVPQTAALLITLPRIAGCGLANLALPWLLYSFGTTFVFYTIGVFCCMLAGHTFAAIVYYAFFNCAEALIVLLYRAFVSENVFGMMEMNGTGSIKQFILSPLVYITMGCRLDYSVSATANGEYSALEWARYEGALPLGLYCIAAAVLLAVTLLLYRKRALETAGEMSAFAFVRPLMRWTIAFGVGTAMAFFISVSTNSGLNVFLTAFVIFSLVVFFFTEMILRKNFRIFKKSVVLEAILCSVIFTAIFLFLKNDPANLLNRVPDTGKIQAASVSGSYTVAKNDPEGIEEIRKLHQSILDHKEDYERYNNGSYYRDGAYVELTSLRFAYVTGSGDTITRVYSVPAGKMDLADPESAVSIMNRLEGDPQTFAEYLFGVNSDDVIWSEGSFRDTDLDAKTAAAVYEAYKKDVLEGNVPYHTGDPQLNGAFRYSFPVNISGTAPNGLTTIYNKYGLDRGYGYYGGYGFSPVWTSSRSPVSDADDVMCSFSVSETCTHTIEALTKAGLIDGLEEMEKIFEEETNGV